MRVMNEEKVSESLAALGDRKRLAIYRILVQAGDQGASPTAIAAALGVPAGTLPFHLGRLHRAGLIEPRRAGRAMVYVAQRAALEQVLVWLSPGEKAD